MKHDFFFSGMPRTQGSMRNVGRRGGRAVLVHSNALLEWRASVIEQARAQFARTTALTGALKVDMRFYLSRPKKHYGKKGLRSKAPVWHYQRPDKDKLERAICDALTHAGVWLDDAQCTGGEIWKEWCDPGEEGAAVQIMTLECEE